MALERVVTNLLTNAVKFTPDGGRIGLGARARRRRRRRRTTAPVRLIVSDSGIGIPAADLDRVFARFYRTSAANERAIQGSGLGLSIVRAIVEGHGGSRRGRVGPGAGLDLHRAPARIEFCGAAPGGRGRSDRDHGHGSRVPGGLAPGVGARDGSGAVAGLVAADSARDDDDEGPGAMDALDPAQLDVARGRRPADEGQGTGGVEPREPLGHRLHDARTVTTQTCTSGTRVIIRRPHSGDPSRTIVPVSEPQRRTRSRPRRRGPGRARWRCRRRGRQPGTADVHASGTPGAAIEEVASTAARALAIAAPTDSSSAAERTTVAR